MKNSTKFWLTIFGLFLIYIIVINIGSIITFFKFLFLFILAATCLIYIAANVVYFILFILNLDKTNKDYPYSKIKKFLLTHYFLVALKWFNDKIDKI
jgi:hypothetical protein